MAIIRLGVSLFPAISCLPVPASADLSFLFSTSPAVTCRRNTTAMDEAYLQMFRDEASLYNRIVLGSLLPGAMWQQLPHFLQKWLRNYIAGVFIYFVSCFLWCFSIYYRKRNVYVDRDATPSKRIMVLQIYTTMKSMPWFCALPTIIEYMVENGWTKCFPAIADVGFLAYALYLIIYLAILEFAIYWIHRELHEIKLLYKYLHSTHHIYNKQNILSPFAGMASHPIDGILHAIPHMAAVFLVPIHFRTHIFLIFFEGIWTANIHDCIHGKLWPIMGAGYHTLHHTTYRHNYGHYTILMDWMFGTLKNPVDEGLKLM